MFLWLGLIYKVGSDKIAKWLPPHVVGAMIIIIGPLTLNTKCTSKYSNSYISVVV